MRQVPENALIAIFERIRQQAKKDVWDEQARDDIVGDCMLILLEKQSTGLLEDVANIEAYSMSVFNVLLQAHIRKTREVRERVRRLPEDYENQLQELVTPLTECTRNEAKTLIACAIESLRQSRDRLVIRLWYLDECASQEIARQCRLPQQRLHGVMHRARERLRPKLAAVAP